MDSPSSIDGKTRAMASSTPQANETGRFPRLGQLQVGRTLPEALLPRADLGQAPENQSAVDGLSADGGIHDNTYGFSCHVHPVRVCMMIW